jgi:hypothetical protein
VSVFERVCALDECLQCWADQVIAATTEDVEAAIYESLEKEPIIHMIGMPSDDEMAKMRRSGRREVRLVARLVLLEPHECGKASA